MVQCSEAGPIHAAGYLVGRAVVYAFGAQPLFGDAVFGAAQRQRVRIKAQRLGLELGALSQYEDSPPCHVLILSPTIGNIYIWDSPQPMHNILGLELAGTIICKLHI